MNKKPLVSIIIPAYNEQEVIERLLGSIKRQTYKDIEIVIIDDGSTDRTVAIAKKYTQKVYQRKHAERSIQRNFGAYKSKGKYLFFVDSDMELTKKLVENCVEVAESDPKVLAVIVPEESFGIGFWSECKKLERSFYVGVDFMEATRFFKKDAFIKVGGFDPELVSGEDWYLSQKLEKIGKIGRAKKFILHNEGNLSLIGTIKKKFYYAKYIKRYVDLKENLHVKNQLSLTKRYLLFLSNPKKLFKDPVLGVGMLFMKTCEFAAGGLGYLISFKDNLKDYQNF